MLQMLGIASGGSGLQDIFFVDAPFHERIWPDGTQPAKSRRPDGCGAALGSINETYCLSGSFLISLTCCCRLNILGFSTWMWTSTFRASPSSAPCMHQTAQSAARKFQKSAQKRTLDLRRGSLRRGCLESIQPSCPWESLKLGN